MALNRLGEETSPYLQQHKDNPVQWWPWCQDAFEEAQRLDKPVLLSVGYAACHWCHVMAHESFEDEATAELMNELFVNIKVDREERPDIDTIYMTALQALGEQGGWPLTMFLTPDGKPFCGGTYFRRRRATGVRLSPCAGERRARLCEEKETIAQNTARANRGSHAAGRRRPRLSSSAGQLAAWRAVRRRHRSDERGPARRAEIPQRGDFGFPLACGLRYGEDLLEEVKNTSFISAKAVSTTIRRRLRALFGGRALAGPAFREDALRQRPAHRTHDGGLEGDAVRQLKARVSETIGWIERDMLMPGGGFAASSTPIQRGRGR